MSAPGKGTQTQSLCLEGSKAVKCYMIFPGSGENGKPTTLYANIGQQNYTNKITQSVSLDSNWKFII